MPLNSPAVKIQQLRFLAAVAQNDLNITAAAAKLCTTQPAVSKQLKLLEDEDRGTLSIGTTHTQARYVLPPVIQTFRDRYPNVQFHLHQGTAEQIAEMAEFDRIDFAIATGSQELFGKYALLPC
jgi:LysR family cys regulon transcriptional activator